MQVKQFGKETERVIPFELALTSALGTPSGLPGSCVAAAPRTTGRAILTATAHTALRSPAGGRPRDAVQAYGCWHSGSAALFQSLKNLELSLAVLGRPTSLAFSSARVLFTVPCSMSPRSNKRKMKQTQPCSAGLQDIHAGFFSISTDSISYSLCWFIGQPNMPTILR